MQFLQLIESIVTNLNSNNISQFITLTENLVALSESVISHIQTDTTSK